MAQPLQNITLDSIRQVFSQLLTFKEPLSTKIPTSELVVCLVFHFSGQAKDFFSLESLRRSLINQTGTLIQRSSFWERLNTNKLTLVLSELYSHLLLHLSNSPLRAKDLCQLLKVQDIVFIDSTSSLVAQGGQNYFPGTFNRACIKHHLCLSLLSGRIQFADYSEGSSHDSNHFPPQSMLKGKLILFDLAYYDFERFYQINEAGGFFFSKVKEGCGLKVVEIKKGLPSSCLGKKMSEIQERTYSKKEIDVVVELKEESKAYRFRVVGFYNAKEGQYHFYLTNLVVEVEKLRKVYNLRWQVELYFRGSKQSLSLEKYPSEKLGVITNLVLGGAIAQIIGTYLFQEGCKEIEEEEKKLGISFQRVFLIVNLLSRDFKDYILSAFKRKPPLSFSEKVKLLIGEFCDPDKKRKNSLQSFSKPDL